MTRPALTFARALTDEFTASPMHCLMHPRRVIAHARGRVAQDARRIADDAMFAASLKIALSPKPARFSNLNVR